jgi:hypothetical protein
VNAGLGGVAASEKFANVVEPPADGVAPAAPTSPNAKQTTAPIAK